jgi:predicted nuclease with TOPRIM domain
MREKLIKRLEQLKTEFQLGQTKLQELEGRTNALRNNLLRISGAIQVLQEELGIGGELALNSKEKSPESEQKEGDPENIGIKQRS